MLVIVAAGRGTSLVSYPTKPKQKSGAAERTINKVMLKVSITNNMSNDKSPERKATQQKKVK